MDINNKRFLNILKIMVNECEKFANALERYSSFKEEFSGEEWNKLIENFSESELEMINQLDERFNNHCTRINKEFL